ncbi:hypothetical protein [Pseudomonas sp. PSKL.D1]|uniref:hypothetical protein n=1 Tax=Pseudomonas sp. PSKL.D1 TaxID=3029060 RepID=UPI0023812070|nr:hypothetical protein [Pseudomonas sp. PSKL.D1]WDY56197.1 hypothetical protein PVV54_16490 [Pseudomonas sp. PSKL.D1]
MLYCFYLGDDCQVMMTSRHALGSWSVPVELGIQSFSGLPAVYTFKGRIYVYSSAEIGLLPTGGNRSRLLSWTPGEEIRLDEMTLNVYGAPSVAERNGKLYLFWRNSGFGELRWATSSLGDEWHNAGYIRPQGMGQSLARSAWDPVVCLYQRLLHVFYQTKQGLALIRFDGETGWSRGQLLIDKTYHYMPAVFVHDGLLTLAFANLSSPDATVSVTTPPDEQTMGNIHESDVQGTLDLVRYDGNALGLVDRSIGVLVKGAPSAAVLAGDLYVVFPSE